MKTTNSSPNEAVDSEGGPSVGTGEKSSPRARRKRPSGPGSGSRSAFRRVTVFLLALAVIGAPLACGAVHRPMLLVTLGVAMALGIATAVHGHDTRAQIKPSFAVALPLLFLLIAAAQIVPIPWGLRAWIDPAGSALLALDDLKGAQPLSLDPPGTYLELAKAATALSVLLAALVLSANRRSRFVSLGLVAYTGLAAFVVGLGNRLVFEDKIYGLFSRSRGLLNGPFINANHTAEFLELAAFAALAFSFSRSSRDGQRVWKGIAALLAAGALSTLSRGSVLALGAGALVWFLLAPKSDEGEPFHRTRFATGLITLLVVAGTALGFGAENLLARFAENSTGRELRLEMWWSALKMLPAHPAGIGLGAFGRVFPVYRDFPTGVWFQFPENQPLGFLVEAGIPGTVIMVGVCVLVLRHFFKNARHDRIEASLVAGLAAVLAHNLTDFGLETLGVLLPFCALMGTIFGRQANVLDEPVRQPATVAFAVGATAILLLAVALLVSPSTRDFDRMLKAPVSPATRGAIRAASVAHPTDYLYALAEARLEPIAPAASSRLRMLNRATVLCPTCPETHAETARHLWRGGRRPQALLEWRTVLGIVPDQLGAVFAELVRSGAKPEELASLANDRNRYELNQHLLGHGMIDAARGVLAGVGDHEGVDVQLAQAQVALAANDFGAARAASEAASAAAPRDPRVVLLASDIALRQNQRDKAIELLQVGLQAQPREVELNRKLLGLLTQTDRWQAIDGALAGLRMAMNEAGMPMIEANLAAAHIFERRGQFYRAVTEYQAALAQHPDDIGVQLALARAAEQAGRVTTAIEAYNAVLQRAPENSEARVALSRIQRDRKLFEVFGGHVPQTGVNGPR